MPTSQLAEEKRRQLDAIVQKMVANKEPDANVQFVVDDFKRKYATPTPPAAAPAKRGIGTKVVRVAEKVTGALGLRPAVDTISSNLATLAHPKLAQRRLIDQPSLMDNVKAGAAIGINTAGADVAGPKAAALAAKTAAESVATKLRAAVMDTLAPKLTAKETAEALAARGGSKTGVLRKVVVNPDPAVGRIAETVQKFVPDFNPAKTLVENISVTRTALSKLATELKAQVVASGKDRIYSFKELAAQLKTAEKPTLLVGDLEKVYEKVIGKMLEIARSHGGKVSDLLAARKEFDDFVTKEFPNLYSSDTLTPMRSAIKSIRRTVNDYIAEHLPQEIGFHDSLTHQSRLFEAIDNMAEKAASGAAKEVGTNIISRAAKRHPKAARIIKYGLAGLAGAGGAGIASDAMK